MPGLEVIWRRSLEGREGAEYDRFVDDARGGSYAQARAWADAARAGRRFSQRFALVRRNGALVGASMLLRARAIGRVPAPFAVIERGPVTGSLDDLGDVLAATRRSALLHGIVRLQVMPYWADDEALAASRVLADSGFKDVQEASGAHVRTLRVPLSGKAEDQIFAGKQGESLRRKLRQAEKAGAVARRGSSADMPTLERLYGELMGGQGRGGKPRPYFDALGHIVDAGTRGAVFLCEHDGQALSALYAARHGRLATFVLGASSQIERSFSKMVPAMAAAIRWAHAEGCEAFDMGGIPMESDTDEKRRSIAQFKLDFAKTPVTLVHEHARWA